MPTPFSRTLRSLTQDSPREGIVYWLIGGFFLVAWLAWFFFTKVSLYEFTNKARLEVEHSAHPITALVSGKVISTTLALGEVVKKGEVVISLDANSEQLSLKEEEAKLNALPYRIDALEKEISALEQAKSKNRRASLAAIQSAKSRYQEATAAVAFAKENDKRLSTLKNSGKIAVIDAMRVHAEVEKLSASRDAINSETRRLEMELETQSHQNLAEIEDIKSDVAKLKGELSTAEMTIARLNQDIEKHTIRIPADGQIGEVMPLQVGTYISAGEKIGTVIPQSKLRITADFSPAAAIGRIHRGQMGMMRLDGFPWAQYGVITAAVTRVGSEIRDNQVRVEFAPSKSFLSRINLQHGLPGSIEVNVEQTTPALLAMRVAGQWFSEKETPR